MDSARVGKALAERMPGGLLVVGASRARTYYYDLMVTTYPATSTMYPTTTI